MCICFLLLFKDCLAFGIFHALNNRNGTVVQVESFLGLFAVIVSLRVSRRQRDSSSRVGIVYYNISATGSELTREDCVTLACATLTLSMQA